MAVRIEETDFGTKTATHYKLAQLMEEAPTMFDRLMFRYWQKVYSVAVRECPVQTGALRDSIRIQKGRKTTGKYVAGRGDTVSEYYIVAGGGGYINPRHKKEVDYARAVHDGTGVRPGNPFLDRAIEITNRDFEEFINKYLSWIETEWAKDQPPVSWSVSLPVSEYQAGLEGRR